MYTKRNSDSPGELVRFDYEMLEDKMKALVERKGESENYYTSRRSEIEMDWLREEIDQDKNYVWHANMPLPFWQCRRIFDSAMKMPKKSVRFLIFPDYELNTDEEALFDVIYEYGRSSGLEVVAERLYEGASNGDPRAVKMYLEVVGLIGDEVIDDEEAMNKLMKIELNI